jgi:L-2-hydroxyglutarate oxidase LhgO
MSALYEVDTVVIGAGIVGIAIARELAAQGHEVLVVERERQHGLHQSSRNSGVIHAGFYYPVGSLKARLCCTANADLYRYAESRGIPHKRVGKMVVAADAEEVRDLERLASRGIACGVRDLEMLDADQARRLEPELSCVAALWSPSTGVVDALSYLLSLRGEAEANGASFAMGCRVVRGEANPAGWRLEVESGDGMLQVDCRLLINSAGVEAPLVARALDAYPEARVPKHYLAKGHFFSCTTRTPFTHLIYPVPGSVGLGVHLTLDLDGSAKFGPDVEIVDRVSYDVPLERAEKFYSAIRGFWPGLRDRSLQPAYAGIRAKIGRVGDPQDWVIETPAEHGLPGLVNLFGIETPGMTCAMALGQEVARRVRMEVFA